MSKEFWAGRLVAHRIRWRGPWYHRLHRAGVALGLIDVPVFRVSPYVEAITIETEAALDDFWQAVSKAGLPSTGRAMQVALAADDWACNVAPYLPGHYADASVAMGDPAFRDAYERAQKR